MVLYPERRTDVGQTRGFEELLAGRVTRVYLDEWAVAQPMSPTLGLIELLLTEPSQAIAKARTILADTLPVWPDFKVWVEAVLIYKLPRLTREEIKAMVHLIDVDLKDTRYYQEVAAEVRQESKADLLLHMMKKRFGDLAPFQETIVQSMSEDRLVALSEALLDFSGPDDFALWLAQNTKH